MATAIEDRKDTEVDPREFDTPEFQHDPFPVYKKLRDYHPVFHDRFHNRWIISRYDDIMAVFRDTEAYTRGQY
ncbi:MAG: hypothetical protein R3360_02240, partial [Alphaproteobacteria bacterium]|nr:hypothetical protein [Alphaproteobacteria bacterium]